MAIVQSLVSVGFVATSITLLGCDDGPTTATPTQACTSSDLSAIVEHQQDLMTCMVTECTTAASASDAKACLNKCFLQADVSQSCANCVDDMQPGEDPKEQMEKCGLPDDVDDVPTTPSTNSTGACNSSDLSAIVEHQQDLMTCMVTECTTATSASDAKACLNKCFLQADVSQSCADCVDDMETGADPMKQLEKCGLPHVAPTSTSTAGPSPTPTSTAGPSPSPSGKGSCASSDMDAIVKNNQDLLTCIMTDCTTVTTESEAKVCLNKCFTKAGVSESCADCLDDMDPTADPKENLQKCGLNPDLHTQFAEESFVAASDVMFKKMEHQPQSNMMETMV